MNKENTQKVVNFLLKKRETYGDKVEIPGVGFENTGLSLSEAKDVLVYLDKNNLICVWVINYLFDVDDPKLAPRTWRYKDRSNHHLNLDPIIIEINKNHIKKLADSGFTVGEIEELSSTKKTDKGSPGKLTLYQSSGNVVYQGPSGKTCEKKFGTKANYYLLLKFLAQNQSKTFEAEELDKKLNKPRSHANSPLPDRRVRDLIDYIREILGILKEDDPFIVEKGSFGIECNVEFKS